MHTSVRPSITLIAVLALGLGACGADESADEPTGGATQQDPQDDAAGTESDEDPAEDFTEGEDAAPDTGDDQDVATSDQGMVTATGLEWVPTELTISAGESVRFVNDDQQNHTVTAGSPGDPNTDGFDEDLDINDSVEIAFDEPGTYAFFCEIHPSMVGEVTVE